jgi:hypothetical protein
MSYFKSKVVTDSELAQPSAASDTALCRDIKGDIMVAGSIQEHKTGPFNTTADVTIKFVLDRCE